MQSPVQSRGLKHSLNYTLFPKYSHTIMTLTKNTLSHNNTKTITQSNEEGNWLSSKNGKVWPNTMLSYEALSLFVSEY